MPISLYSFKVTLTSSITPRWDWKDLVFGSPMAI